MPDENKPEETALGTHSATLEVGLKVFRQYVLKRFLSRGPLGSGWLVVHEGIGRELAMRFVPESWLRDDRVMTRLRDGAVRLLDIAHPALVGILDLVRDSQMAAIVSKFFDAETALDAKAHRQDRCFEAEDLRPWLAQACDALDFAWRQHGAIHGDFSPVNLLISSTGETKVADFGLARNLFDLESPSGGPLIPVNLSHASPERAHGAPVTVADDVYGFGATIFDLMTSRPPFFRGNVRWQLDSVVAPKMAERRTELGIVGGLIPPEWEEVIAACLAKLPEDRPASVREAAERLGLLAPLSPDHQRISTPVYRPRPAETVASLQPRERLSTGPVPEFPSTLATVPMEPQTMMGAARPAEAANIFPPPPALSEMSSESESTPATVDESLDPNSSFSGIEPEPAAPAVPAPVAPPPLPEEMEGDPDATMVGGSFRPAPAAPAGPPPLPTPPPLPPSATVEPTDSAAAAEAPAPSAPRNAGFVPPPGLQYSDDDASATMAADPTPVPPAPPTPPAAEEPEEDYEMTRRPTPSTPPPVAPPSAPRTFVPPPGLSAESDEADMTMVGTPIAPPPLPEAAAPEPPPAALAPAEPILEAAPSPLPASPQPDPAPEPEAKVEAIPEVEPTAPEPARFVPPPGLQPGVDEGALTVASEEPPPLPPPPVAESEPTPEPPPVEAVVAPPLPPAPPPLAPPPATREPEPELDLEATVMELPPARPAAPAPAPAPEPHFDFEATMDAVPPVLPPAAIAPPPIPAPAIPPLPVPHDLEESVTIPTPVRSAAPPAPEPPRPSAPIPAPIPPPPMPTPASGGFKWWWAVIPAAVVAIGAGAFFGLSRSGSDQPEPTPYPMPPPTPVPTPVATPMPTPVPPAATPTPVPATPLPQARKVSIAELVILVDRPITEPILLTGSYKIGIATPSSGATAAHTTMRPSDPSISGKFRVMSNLPPTASLPAEGAVVDLTPESRYFIRRVWRGEDGQINVEAEQR